MRQRPLASMALVLGLFVAPIQALPDQSIKVPRIGKPSKAATLSDPESAAIRAATTLFDQGKVNEAMAALEEVRRQYPNNAVALYELGLGYQALGRHQEAIDHAARALEYRLPDDLVSLCYALIGNSLDLAKEPKKAVEIYRKGIAAAPHTTLYFNLGVTYAISLKDLAKAKDAFTSAAWSNPSHAGTHLLLAQMYLSEGQRVPALYALSRFLMLEPRSRRSPDAYRQWSALIGGARREGADGSVTIDIAMSRLKTEGDFTRMDAMLGLMGAALMNAEPDSDTPRLTKLGSMLNAIFQVYVPDPGGKDKRHFVVAHYVPFFADLGRAGLMVPFVYYVSQSSNAPDVREWLAAHDADVNAMLARASAFAFDTPKRK